MSPTLWVATVLLAGAAVVVAWPVRSSRRRRRALLGPAPRSAGPADTTPPGSRLPWPGPLAVDGPAVAGSGRSTASTLARLTASTLGRSGAGPALPGSAEAPGDAPAAPAAPILGLFLPGHVRRGPHPVRLGRPGRSTVGRPGAIRFGGALRRLRPVWSGAGRPRRVMFLVGLVGAGTGVLTAGPVAAVLLAGYGVLGARGLLRRRAQARAGRERRLRLDRLAALAADLRAGLPVPALAGTGGSDRLDELARAAVRLADRTGAPLAELLDRVEADARAHDRGLASAAAQAAGARATALLLAALPLGGIGLGYGIGADPLAVLLHTPVGGACAVAAMGLQAGGLLWAERLGRTPDGSA
ncbi:hypothetical protein [Micromonospora sp. NPDC092111]|uniref:hypothetical protein n=1 Tax=Micromonospora sp. NPDC092111 TaxID=3364289 RepID=UPI003822D61C